MVITKINEAEPVESKQAGEDEWCAFRSTDFVPRHEFLATVEISEDDCVELS